MFGGRGKRVKSRRWRHGDLERRLKAFVGIRLDAEDEFKSTDLTIHKVSASAARATLW